MATMTLLNPAPVVPIAQTRYQLEALEAGRPSAGLTATVRVTEAGTTTIHKSDTLILADEAARRIYASSTLTRIDAALTPGAPTADELEAALLDMQTAVEAALRGPTGGAGIAGAPASPGSPGSPLSLYAIEHGHIIWRKPLQGGFAAVPLCNFEAVITGERVVDDGATERIEFDVAGALEDGRRLRTLQVPADRFGAMQWPTAGWGTRAVVHAGAAIRDHLRAGIQILSGDVERHVTYAHCGWRTLEDGNRVYLHGGGGIGKDGALPAGLVDVALSPNLKPLVLPDPPAPDSPELVQAVAADLALLDLAPDRVMVPLLAAVYRAPLAEIEPVDVSVFVVGPSGTFKTETSALAQQHYGAGFDRKHLPAEWSSTANALERVLFEAKDAIGVIDDYAPAGTTLGMQKLQETAGRVLRGVGNHQGRGRLTADTSRRPTFLPRGLLLSSGEDVPASSTTSIVARLVALEVRPGDVNVDVLTTAQARAQEGWYARTMSAYLQWLAPRLDDERDLVADRFATLCSRASDTALHRRTPEAVATLGLGWLWFLRFASDRGAITEAERTALWERGWTALGEMAQDQKAAQEDQDPIGRYFEALLTALASGHAHIAGPDGEAPAGTDDPRAWGWRRKIIGTGDYIREEWEAKGERIGWVEGGQFYLDPGASYNVAATQAHRSGGTIGVQQVTLHKRLHEGGAIASVEKDGKKTRLCIRQTLEGRQRRVLHILPGLLLGGESGLSGLSGHPEPSDEAVQEEPSPQTPAARPTASPPSGGKGQKGTSKSGLTAAPTQGRAGGGSPQSPLSPLSLSTDIAPIQQNGVAHVCVDCGAPAIYRHAGAWECDQHHPLARGAA
jgi:hypothetical protein